MEAEIGVMYLQAEKAKDFWQLAETWTEERNKSCVEEYRENII